MKKLIAILSRYSMVIILSLSFLVGAAINYTSTYYKYSLSQQSIIKAVTKGDAKVLAFLLNNGGNANAYDGEGESILHKAITKGDINIIELLLDKGADPNAINPFGDTPLQRVVNLKGLDRFKRKSMLALLLYKGADPKQETGSGQPILSSAFINKWGHDPWDRDAIELLLKAGADINAADKYGNAVLFFAMAQGDSESIENLISYHPQVNITNECGESPYEYARRYYQNDSMGPLFWGLNRYDDSFDYDSYSHFVIATRLRELSAKSPHPNNKVGHDCFKQLSIHLKESKSNGYYGD